MFRFTIREILLVTAVVALALVLIVERWPFGRERRLSKDELDVYGAAIRYHLSTHDPDGLLFLQVAGHDPPKELTGVVMLPASQAHVADGPASRVDYYPTDRFRSISDGSPGTLYSAWIERWLSGDRVEVKCNILVSRDYGWGESIILHRKNGKWQYESTANEWDV